MSVSTRSGVKSMAALKFPMQTLDPFLFSVQHHDQYPAATSSDDMGFARPGNGADFDWSKPYRMYHGHHVAGFPRHPHRGFETITATIGGRGLIAHSDSYGNSALFGRGDIQWMTAGKGIQHSEMFPLLFTDTPNDINFFQIWLNLPADRKMTEPSFSMHWAEGVQRAVDDDAGYSVTVFAGEFGGESGQTPPPASWAADPNNEVTILHIVLRANGGRVTLPASAFGDAVNRRAYLFHSDESGVTVAGEAFAARHCATLDASVDVEFVNNSDDQVADILVLSGRPIGEPVVQHGPFVMNTRDEIAAAFRDYQQTAFGPPGDDRPSWPYDSDAPVTLADNDERVRFARQNGVETRPPTNTN